MTHIRSTTKSLRHFWMLITVMACAGWTGIAIAQPPSDADSKDLEAQASAAFQDSEWPKAAQLYAELTRAKPDDATAWYRSGFASVSAGTDLVEARQAFEKAIELGYPAPQAIFGVTRSYALESNEKEVIASLERLAELGPSRRAVSIIMTDPLFEALSTTSEVEDLIQRLTPCATDEYRQFDFWLGSWRVESPQGQFLGTNSVTEAMDGCLLVEDWESASGHKGMSFNYYDHRDQTWNQIFKDNSGNPDAFPDIKGSLIEGAMVLESAPDSEPRTRWTWTQEEGGRVRQKAEFSNDGGETWTVGWDSYYVPTTEEGGK